MNPDNNEIIEIEELEAQLKVRCEGTGISVQIEKDVLDDEIVDVYFSFRIPQGRDHRTVYLMPDDVPNLLRLPFEKYVFLNEYLALCSYERDQLIAGIRTLGRLGKVAVIRALFGKMPASLQKEGRVPAESSETLTLDIPVPPHYPNATVQLSTASELLSTLAFTGGAHVFVILSGFGFSSQDHAVQLLRKLTDSLFLEIDLSLELPLSLVRDSDRVRRFRRRYRDLEEPMPFAFPRFEYDHDALSLYWYAKAAAGMPLLQYLAYYQTIEYYMPVYSEKDAGRRVGNILKNPTFNPNRDTDLLKILLAVRSSTHRGFGDELSQLRATLQECVDPSDVRAFIAADGARAEFLVKNKQLSSLRINSSNPTVDIIQEIAQRVYDIRCKIVHTKGATKEGEIDRLLPFSSEADLLSYDIELIEFLSRKVIVAGATTMQLPASTSFKGKADTLPAIEAVDS